MEERLYGTRLYVSYANLENNINYLQRYYSISKVIAMVKANAYGHGDIVIAKKLESFGISSFGVADFEEGIRLRNNNIKSAIIVMNPAINNLKVIIDNKLEPVIYNTSILLKLQNILEKFESRFIKNPILGFGVQCVGSRAVGLRVWG